MSSQRRQLFHSDCRLLVCCAVPCCDVKHAGWLNRLASGAAVTINITQDTVKTVSKQQHA
jgi:hypothetical protein